MEHTDNNIIHTSAINNTTQYLKIFLLGTIVFCFIQYIWKKRKQYKMLKQISGPRTLPFIGNSHLLMGDGDDILNKVMKLLDDYNGVLKFWLGPILIIAFDSPELSRKLLNHSHCINKPDVYLILGDVLREGLITSPGTKWRRHRKILSPSFNQKILDSFVETFYEKSVILCDNLKGICGKKEINFYYEVTKCTLDIICQTAMGVDMDIQKSNHKFAEVFENTVEILNYRIFRFWYHPKLIWKLSPKSWKLAECIKYFDNITSEIIRKKLETYNKVSHETPVDAEDGQTKKRMAFLDLIVEESLFTEAELLEEVITFLLAGTETSASTMCFICVVLGLFPDVQQKVYDEVIDVIGTDGRVVSSHLGKLQYTDRVIKEVLRIFPIVPLIARQLTEDVPLEDFTIPQGSVVSIGVANLHRNPKYWPDPLKFDPDRFLPEEVAKRHPCSYMPFSFGVRNCLGYRYAMQNMKTMLATLISQYSVHTEYKSIEEIQLKMNVVLRMKDGPKIWFESRNS